MKAGRHYNLFPKEYGIFPYIWPIYLLIPLTYTLQENGLKLYAGLLLIAIFLFSYQRLYWVSHKKYDYWIATQLAIILLFSLWINAFYLYMGFFTAYSIGHYTDTKKFKRAIVALTITELIPIGIGFFQGFQLEGLLFAIPFLLVMIITPFGTRSGRQKKELKKQLIEANEQIKTLIQQEERMRIARDLHDTLGHTLTLITLKSQLVSKLIPRDPSLAVTEAKEIEQTSRAALSQVRELVSDMRTITIEEVLAESKHILEAANISLEVGSEATAKVPALIQNILSMCIREAITNIVKHSHATACHISFMISSSVINMTIKDNGQGIANQQLLQLQQGGNGLNGIKERLALIEGNLELTSNPDGGSTLKIAVPLAVKKHD